MFLSQRKHHLLFRVRKCNVVDTIAAHLFSQFSAQRPITPVTATSSAPWECLSLRSALSCWALTMSPWTLDYLILNIRYFSGFIEWLSLLKQWPTWRTFTVHQLVQELSHIYHITFHTPFPSGRRDIARTMSFFPEAVRLKNPSSFPTLHLWSNTFSLLMSCMSKWQYKFHVNILCWPLI